jgi:hypothetical protein
VHKLKTRLSRMSVDFQRTTWSYIPVGMTFHDCYAYLILFTCSLNLFVRARSIRDAREQGMHVETVFQYGLHPSVHNC